MSWAIIVWSCFKDENYWEKDVWIINKVHSETKTTKKLLRKISEKSTFKREDTVNGVE